MTNDRAWQGYATDTGEGSRLRYADVALNRSLAAMYTCGRGPLVEVTITEDPDGVYAGWIYTGDTDPVMIQHHRIFPMQFAYGVQAEVDTGAGHPIRLNVTANTDPKE